jgi:hypothetical protein
MEGVIPERFGSWAFGKSSRNGLACNDLTMIRNDSSVYCAVEVCLEIFTNELACNDLTLTRNDSLVYLTWKYSLFLFSRYHLYSKCSQLEDGFFQ